MNRTENYETLMRSVRNMFGDMPNIDKASVRKGFDQFLINSLMSLDVHGVIRNDKDFQDFKKDLLGR